MLSLLALAGCASIAVGWAIQGNTFVLHGAARAFLPGLLTNVGTALLLGALFVVVQASLSEQVRKVDASTQALEQRVEDVSDEVKATANRLSELSDETRRLLGETRERDAAIVQAVKNDASFESVAALLARAQELRVVSQEGPRVAMAHDERLRFRLAFAAERIGTSNAMILIRQEGASGIDRKLSAIWSPGEEFPEVLVRLAEEMKSRAAYPGDSVFDATQILTDLIETMSIAIKQREHERGDMHALGRVVERINGEWVLTEDGLEHLSRPPYAISPEQLLDDEFFHEHMLEKLWINQKVEQFEDAWEISRSYHENKRKRKLPLIAPEGD